MIEIVSPDDLRAALAPIRDKLLSHPLYSAVDTISRLRLFMSQHVFAVWDFMCLVKRLQRDLTPLQELWLPPTQPSLARFINSVVLVEESDFDQDDHAASHFELYLAAMEEIGAPVAPVRRFIELLQDGGEAQSSLGAIGAPQGVRNFIANTLETVRKGTTIEVLASFLFGREDLIPEMFSRLLPRWSGTRQARRFAYYIYRHIEVDGEEHGPTGFRILTEVAGRHVANWQIARQAAQSAINARIALWDSVYASLIGA